MTIYNQKCGPYRPQNFSAPIKPNCTFEKRECKKKLCSLFYLSKKKSNWKKSKIKMVKEKEIVADRTWLVAYRHGRFFVCHFKFCYLKHFCIIKSHKKSSLNSKEKLFILKYVSSNLSDTDQYCFFLQLKMVIWVKLSQKSVTLWASDSFQNAPFFMIFHDFSWFFHVENSDLINSKFDKTFSTSKASQENGPKQISNLKT